MNLISLRRNILCINKLSILFIFATLLFFVNGSFAQVTLRGELSEMGDSGLIIQYYQGNQNKTDNIKISGGRFIWESPVIQSQKTTLIFPGRAIYLFVDPGVMTLRGSRNDLDNVIITGSKTNDEAIAYAQKIAPFETEQRLLFAENAKSGNEQATTAEERLAEIYRRKMTSAMTYISENPNSTFSLSLVSEYSRLSGYEQVLEMYNLLGKELRTGPEGLRIADRLSLLKRSAIGVKMKDFVIKDNKDNKVSLTDFNGKYVLIDFWASWCAPCRKQIPNLIDTFEKYKDKNFTILSISLDDRKDRWLAAIAAFNMPWKQVSDLKGWESELAVFYGIKGIPFTLLIDPQGIIQARDLSGKALDHKLSGLLK
ncbi:hypothetical protein ASU31_00560 [Pedobacter ginsenosidimutans]|uniref:Thioredoxin domain-containing protein n=1 Tax=Pedobacter ginsenosidimutans TaxID=687842 RepID=A0A0T5VVP0_9SPHI|nr:TlpA disulfide reductase family protein [Pedobacter ginsenosidimutans]KRT17823.1 hypothetical protein ASU31_00560 [Pedobacter ginsenosidimutans]